MGTEKQTAAQPTGAVFLAPTHFVCRTNSALVMVKEAAFFCDRGGLTEPWGKNWQPVHASTIGDARRIGAAMFGVGLSFAYRNEP